MCLGVPAKIIEIIDADARLAKVDVSGIKRQVNIACVVDEAHPPEACIGDWVLLHVGFAMSRIDEEEAAKTLELLNELGQMQEELQQLKGESAYMK